MHYFLLSSRVQFATRNISLAAGVVLGPSSLFTPCDRRSLAHREREKRGGRRDAADLPRMLPPLLAAKGAVGTDRTCKFYSALTLNYPILEILRALTSPAGQATIFAGKQARPWIASGSGLGTVGCAGEMAAI